jgi:hypothetical protein
MPPPTMAATAMVVSVTAETLSQRPRRTTSSKPPAKKEKSMDTGKHEPDAEAPRGGEPLAEGCLLLEHRIKRSHHAGKHEKLNGVGRKRPLPIENQRRGGPDFRHWGGKFAAFELERGPRVEAPQDGGAHHRAGKNGRHLRPELPARRHLEPAPVHHVANQHAGLGPTASDEACSVRFSAALRAPNIAQTPCSRTPITRAGLKLVNDHLRGGDAGLRQREAGEKEEGRDVRPFLDDAKAQRQKGIHRGQRDGEHHVPAARHQRVGKACGGAGSVIFRRGPTVAAVSRPARVVLCFHDAPR